MKNNKSAYLLTIIFVIYISGASFLFNDKWYGIGFSAIVFAIFFISKEKINGKLYSIILVWLLINFLAIVFTGAPLIFERIYNYTLLLIFLPYSILKIVGISFWDKFEKVIFTLTWLSLPLFALNVIFIPTFNSFAPIFQPLTFSRLFGPANIHYWSSLLYVNAVPEGLIFRNCGFMWEPGAFAMMIVLAQILDWLKNGVYFNLRFWIYFVALLTTFSTAGYIAYFILILSRFLNKLSIKYFVSISILLFIFFTYVYNLNFVGGEISQYTEDYQNKALSYDDVNRAYKGNRFTIVYFDVLETLKYPLGYGVVTKEDYDRLNNTIGVNGLSSLLKMWGLLFFIYLMFLLWKFFNLIANTSINTIMLICFYISFNVTIFSSVTPRSPFLYIIFFTPILFVPKKLLTNGKSTT